MEPDATEPDATEPDTPELDAERARNLNAVKGAFDGIEAGDASVQLGHYTDDLVLELPYADPPKRIEGKEAALNYLGVALGAFELHLTIDEVHAGLDPDEFTCAPRLITQKTLKNPQRVRATAYTREDARG